MGVYRVNETERYNSSETPEKIVVTVVEGKTRRENQSAGGDCARKIYRLFSL